jgi:hypothetical protein
MIAYDTTALDNSFLLDEAHNLERSGFITAEQLTKIKSQLRGLKTNKNLLIRFGFFLSGCFLYASSSSMFAFLFLCIIPKNQEILLFLISCFGIGGLELLSRGNHYGYGLDDAFLLGFLLMLGVSVGAISDGNELLIASIVTIASIFTYIRYIHLASALIACLAATATIAYAAFELGSIGKTLLPFIMMLLAAVFYFISRNRLEKLKTAYYYNGILLMNNYTLIVFYLAGNYLVVRELSVILLGNKIPKGQDITFAPFFYAFTFIVPIAYLLFALKKRNRIMLWIGFLALAFSIYTIHYYYAILPIEIALTLGGILLFAFSYFTIKKIKENETGISFKPDRFSNPNALTNAEILIAATQFGLKPTAVDSSKIKFGGGDFSGGGSNGSF